MAEKVKVRIVEWTNKYEVKTKYGGFEVDKPIPIEDLKARAKTWIEGLGEFHKEDEPINEEEYEQEIEVSD